MLHEFLSCARLVIIFRSDSQPQNSVAHAIECNHIIKSATTAGYCWLGRYCWLMSHWIVLRSLILLRCWIPSVYTFFFRVDLNRLIESTDTHILRNSIKLGCRHLCQCEIECDEKKRERKNILLQSLRWKCFELGMTWMSDCLGHYEMWVGWPLYIHPC